MCVRTAVCLFSVRHLSHTVILPSSVSAYLTVIPSIYHRVSFFFCGLFSYLSITVHVIVHNAVLSLQLQHAAPQLGVSLCPNVGSAEPGCFSCTGLLHKVILDVVSVRVDRVVDQNR